MKNRGRHHKVVRHNVDKDGLAGIANTKSYLAALTRPIKQMGARTSQFMKIDKYTKRKWSKRVRGYFKSQTKEDLI